MTLSDAIVFNLLLGLRHWVILMFLKSGEGINISMSTLRRHLKSLTAKMTLSDAIVLYFLLGLRHWEIWMFLKSEEGINISMSTLRRHLKSLAGKDDAIRRYRILFPARVEALGNIDSP